MLIFFCWTSDLPSEVDYQVWLDRVFLAEEDDPLRYVKRSSSWGNKVPPRGTAGTKQMKTAASHYDDGLRRLFFVVSTVTKDAVSWVKVFSRREGRLMYHSRSCVPSRELSDHKIGNRCGASFSAVLHKFKQRNGKTGSCFQCF